MKDFTEELRVERVGTLKNKRRNGHIISGRSGTIVFQFLRSETLATVPGIAVLC